MAQICFNDSLQQIIDVLSCQPKTSALPHPPTDQSLQFKLHFFTAFERNILSAKKLIKSKLQSFIAQNNNQEIDQDEAKLYFCLKNKLSLLNYDIETLLKDELFGLYMDLNDLRLKTLTNSFSPVAQEMLKICIESLGKLVKQYFVFNQYEVRRKVYRNQGQLTQLFSEKDINRQSKLAKEKWHSFKKIEDIMMQEVEQFIESKPLAELFELQMKKQERRLGQSFQMCRVCSLQIRLKQLQRHVYICAKKSELRLQMECKNQQITAIQDKIKTRFLQSCQELVKEPIDEEFRNICKLILHFPKKYQKSTFRRNSLIGLRGDKGIMAKIQGCILSYEEVYGANKLLNQWLTAYKERVFIEKAINSIEVSSLFSEKHQKSEDQDPKLRKTVVRNGQKKWTAFSIKIKQRPPVERKSNKSLYIQSEKHSQTSSRRSQSSQSKNNKKQQIFETIQSKRSLSKKLGKESQEEIQFNVNSINHYSSLPNLPQHDQTLQSKSNISLSSFEILKFLGQGAFGKVYMARRKQTKDVYALKIVKLPQNSQQKQLQSIKNEFQIFKKIGGDHLVNAPFSFCEGSSQIFIMQYMPGGDLRKMLTQQVYFEEDVAKFYIAEIIMAIQLLHNSGIIHRDLKPQNLVIDRKGHLKLTDFGLSQFQVSQKLQKSKKNEADAMNEGRQTKSRKRRAAFTGASKQKIKLIGSPDYIAPEIINQTSFSNYTIDWWSLGVMAYELIIGARPFSGESIHQIIENISNFNIQWPEVGYEEGMISPQAKDLITQLLNKNFMQRLGANGAEELKAHPFFQGLDWQNLKGSGLAFLPKRMTTLYEMASMQESVALRQEIQQFVRDTKRTAKKIKLESFVRYDLLKFETIANMQKKQEISIRKVKRLRTLGQIAFQFQQRPEMNS